MEFKHSTIYGLQVYHGSKKHVGKDRSEIVNFQLSIGINPDSMFNKEFDCTLMCLGENTFYTSDLRQWLYDCFAHFFDLNLTDEVSFRIQLFTDTDEKRRESSLRILKFVRMLKMHVNDYNISINIVKNNMYEFFIAKK
ncbi:hypothetical protein [Myroides odoratimimus]|uniref:hypothetical protein n=1 Tax=Myroides odoratimimus TaxID=76832 RepID=UPI002576D410|nr:hypothetical protein [Myroides odoratimimus]MDM1499102.1 hypothetical protein [Myroides odoratimimus]